MGKDAAAKEVLLDAPLISLGALAGEFRVGPGKVKAVAKRLGMKIAHLPNGRDKLTIGQAQALAREIGESAD